MKVTVLADSNTFIDHYFLGEPGVSYFIEVDGKGRKGKGSPVNQFLAAVLSCPYCNKAIPVFGERCPHCRETL